ncbi:MAG: SufB/SufD family protein, partial [Acidimicrobiales bacterium]
AVVAAPEGLAVDAPVVVVHWLATDGGAVFPRTVVRAGAGSRLTVVEYLASADVAGYVDPVTDIDVAGGASLDYLHLQELGSRVWQTGFQSVRVSGGASVRSTAAAFGGDYARLRIDCKLAGDDAQAGLYGCYFGDGHQTHDFRTLQDHWGPGTESHLLFKGAVRDEARGVYTGLIRVRKGAVGTAAAQANRNLVLSDGARADSLPELMIEENELRQCSHASATGPVSPEHLFYLESRGVPTGVAERLIVLGFFDAVLDQVPVAPLRRRLRATLTAKFLGSA